MTENLSAFNGSAVALGSFDGVHAGHRAILSETVSAADRAGLTPSAFTFGMPPALFKNPGFPGILTDTDEKLALMKECGIGTVLVADFGDIHGLSPEDFIALFLIKKLKAKTVICGEDFRFGADRAGNTDTLRAFFGENAVVLPFLTFNGRKVSSTEIRAMVAEGDVSTAATLLGRPYSLSGESFEGRHDGRRLGFPTINILPPDGKVLPPNGVYITKTVFPDCTDYPSVTNIGLSPTLDFTGTKRLETHLLNFGGGFCPKGRYTVMFLERVRGEFVFGSVNELAEQISKDKKRAEEYFKNN
ncbi:MAG: riboflavin biosynthesis protein RibF [Clostridia bacterium]|nr:riboflavin biosynthesis protein RibF [Clostridia bacterium]